MLIIVPLASSLRFLPQIPLHVRYWKTATLPWTKK